uniref:RING-type domain-containing protein n=1 Tax=Chrysotila carterae TaxID=13221 RepID=A0A7S4F4L1_CHRCT
MDHGLSAANKLPDGSLNKLQSAFECPICAEQMACPASLECGHTFCFKCLQASLRSSALCPMCRYPSHLTVPHINHVLRTVFQTLFPNSCGDQPGLVVAENKNDLLLQIAPLFLSSDVQFPTGKSQLHLFEQRYRLLARRAVAEHKSFAMAAVPAARTFPLSCDPEALVGRIVTLMRIEESAETPDGRWFLSCVGTGRARVTEAWLEEAGLHVARLKLMDEAAEDKASLEELARLHEDSAENTEAPATQPPLDGDADQTGTQPTSVAGSGAIGVGQGELQTAGQMPARLEDERQVRGDEEAHHLASTGAQQLVFQASRLDDFLSKLGAIRGGATSAASLAQNATTSLQALESLRDTTFAVCCQLHKFGIEDAAVIGTLLEVRGTAMRLVAINALLAKASDEHRRRRLRREKWRARLQSVPLRALISLLVLALCVGFNPTSNFRESGIAQALLGARPVSCTRRRRRDRRQNRRSARALFLRLRTRCAQQLIVLQRAKLLLTVLWTRCHAGLGGLAMLFTPSLFFPRVPRPNIY